MKQKKWKGAVPATLTKTKNSELEPCLEGTLYVTFPRAGRLGPRRARRGHAWACVRLSSAPWTAVVWGGHAPGSHPAAKSPRLGGAAVSRKPEQKAQLRRHVGSHGGHQ